MKIFTVTTMQPEWEALTRECVLRVKSYTGMDVEVFTAKDQFDAHVLKLAAPLEFEDFTWFVDSDWWPVRTFEFPEIPTGGIIGVHCTTGHDRYKTTCADLSKVFASTIMGMDMASSKVKHAFRMALSLQSQFYWNGHPKMDEFFLNIAVMKSGLPIEHLDPNWLHNCACREDTIAVHAGGIWPKLEKLKEWAR
jgi:hypothetical protein